MSEEGPKKPPERTVLRPMPGGPQPAGGGQGGAGGPAGTPPVPGRPAPMPGGPGAGGPAVGGPAVGGPAAGGQRTVIGAMPPMPGGPGPAPRPGGFAQQPPQGFGPQPAQPTGFGQPAPQSPQGGFGGQSQGGFGPQPPGYGAPAGGGDWTGGAAPGYGSPGYGMPPAGQGGHWLGTGGQQPDSFFPEASRQPPPRPQGALRPRISLEDALRTRTAGHSAEVNPITAAAAPLLILFGRLRSQIVEMQAVPLMNHVTDELNGFEQRVIDAGVDPHEARVAKYCLCGTADDIVQNLPGSDRNLWIQYSMVARFFNKRDSGVGFFQEATKALSDPARRYYILELMLTCLQLGFEGQYRAMPGGDVELQRIRRQIYETLRRVKPRGDDDISPHWKGVEVRARQRRAGLPVWVAACFAGALLVGGYMAMRTILADAGNRAASAMIDVNPTEPVRITQIQTVAVPAVPPPTPYTPPASVVQSDELARVRKALAPDIDAKTLSVDRQGDFIAVTVNNLVLFDSGSVSLKKGFDAIARHIADALNPEKGNIRVVGHTDNVPLSGRGRFKNNLELSKARAKSVADVLTPLIAVPGRIVVDGKGETEPVADNKTAEGRAQNRRVEILLRRDDAAADPKD